VTDKTPMTIPRAVKIERDLFPKIEPREIRRFSQNNPSMVGYTESPERHRDIN
jgi:hypothetical protein